MKKSFFNFLFRNIPLHFIEIITKILPNHSITARIRGFLMRPFFKKCGKNFSIASGVIINKPEKLVIGENVYIAHNSWINANGNIILEDNVVIGPLSVLATSKHKFINGLVTNTGTSSPIIVGKGTWLASHVVITDGIIIGEGCLVAAGAVVTKDVSNNSTVGGIPAKEISKVSL